MMNRREAIRNILLASAGTVFLTNCSEANVVELLVDGRLQLDRRHRQYLAAISETMLPVAGVSEKIPEPVGFVLTMLNDCHPPEEVRQFAAGFQQYKELMEESRLKIRSSDPEEMLPVVKEILETTPPPEELAFFINTTAQLSVRNLMTSEYYMTEYQDYRLVPGEWDGCAEAS